MILQVRLFAAARQLAGVDTAEVELEENAHVGDLRRALATMYPSLAPLLPHAAFAIDESYASDSSILSDQQQVACIPPVSGG